MADPVHLLVWSLLSPRAPDPERDRALLVVRFVPDPSAPTRQPAHHQHVSPVSVPLLRPGPTLNQTPGNIG